MLIDVETTRKNLKALLEREEVNASLSISKEHKDNFRAACDVEGFNKWAIVLEDLLGQLNESHFSTDKKLKIEIQGFNDRAVTSMNCEAKTWQTFKDGCQKNHFKISDVIESIMSDYISQVEKSHKIKISNGKIKK